MSMARLCRDQGKQVEARELLASVYGWSPKGSTRSISRRPRRCSTSWQL